MNVDENAQKQLYAAFEIEPRINVHRFPVQVELKNERLTLQGEVGSIAAKRLALRLAHGVAGDGGVVDQLQVARPRVQGDGEMLDSLTHILGSESELRTCTLRRVNRGQIELLHDGPDADSCGDIQFSVDAGVITLDGHVISHSHRRMAEVLAWWVPGTCNVVNRLALVPDENDGDDEINDAARLALEMDPLVHADQMRLSTRHGVVTLEGAVACEEEREMAEFDIWCVPGIGDVINRLEVVATARGIR